MRLELITFSLAVSCLLSVLGHAHPTPTQPMRPRLAATYTKQSPMIDGRLDELAWGLASPSSSFVQKFPQQAALPSELTTVRVLYDKSTIYIGIHCIQEHAPIVARLARRDQPVESDWVQINIDTKNNGTGAYLFSVNAAGAMGDGIRFNNTEYSAEWDEIWDARVARLSNGWSAEFAIPLQALQFDSQDVQDWGFQVRRYTSTRQELDEWSYIPRTAAGEVSHYGRLTNLVGLRHNFAVEIRPFMIGRVNWFDMAPARSPIPASNYYVTMGIDVKWHITRSLTLSLTANPDLAQMEADQMIFNLTTFELLFPEKRPFFIEGFDVFKTPMQIFYSRRIGMAPSPPAVRKDPPVGERVLNAPGPSTIYGAAKLTGTIGRQLTVGLLSTLTARNDAQVWLPSTGSVTRLAEPLTLYNLLRLRWAVAENISVGLLATTVNRFEPTHEYPLLATRDTISALCPNGSLVVLGTHCFHDSYVVSVDGLWRSRNGDYVASGQAMVTSSLNGPPRSLPDGSVIQSGGMSPAGRVYLAKEGGQWLGSVEFEGLGRTVDYNDVGFMRRQNQLRLFASLDYRTIVPFWRGRVLETRTHIQYSHRDNLDGLALYRGYYLGTEWRFANFWNVAIELYHYGKRFDDREVGDGTALERERIVGWDITLSTDPRRMISASLFTETMIVFNGFSLIMNGSMTAQLLPKLQIALLPQVVYAFGEPRFISIGSLPSEYLFGRLQARSIGATLRAHYVFTPRLTLQVYTQLFLAAKHYYDFSAYTTAPSGSYAIVRLENLRPVASLMQNPDLNEIALNINVVLRWEFLLGSTLYLLYSRSHTPMPTLQDGESAGLDIGALRSGPSIDSLMFKFSYRLN